jgi:hypothetical protein
VQKQTDPNKELYNLRYSCLNRDRFGKTKRDKRKRKERAAGFCGPGEHGGGLVLLRARARVSIYPPLRCDVSGWQAGPGLVRSARCFFFCFLSSFIIFAF